MAASMKRVSTGTVVTPLAPSSKIEVQYPADWFKSNPDQKPKLKYYKEMEADEDWKSYGLVICKAGNKCNPFSMVELQEEQETANHDSKPAAEDDYAWMATYLLGIYRLVRATEQDYRSTLCERINDQMKSFKSTAGSLTDVVAEFSNWINDATYLKIVACVDMFYNRFPKAPLAAVRVICFEAGRCPFLRRCFVNCSFNNRSFTISEGPTESRETIEMCRILTDTPEKVELEAEQAGRDKKASSVKNNFTKKKKTEKRNRKLKQLKGDSSEDEQVWEASDDSLDDIDPFSVSSNDFEVETDDFFEVCTP
ncbi:unnamed protein product [Brassicogethes aeneus]|uniref:Rhabdovirus nucleocapsid domain-containing protein n=1 Tax=Brassicogethes aeneus TaxID=1431903 RepID=A0A9P0BGI2_BRAAE|nr:unnamed protein product [Brassicogethes aeneus]